jgi:hypothetical protein
MEHRKIEERAPTKRGRCELFRLVPFLFPVLRAGSTCVRIVDHVTCVAKLYSSGDVVFIDYPAVSIKIVSRTLSPIFDKPEMILTAVTTTMPISIYDGEEEHGLAGMK